MAVMFDDLALSLDHNLAYGEFVKSGAEALHHMKERPEIPTSVRHLTCMQAGPQPPALKGLTNYDILRIARHNRGDADGHGSSFTPDDFSSFTQFLGAGAVTLPARHQAGVVAFLTCDAGEAPSLVWPDLGDDEVAEWAKTGPGPGTCAFRHTRKGRGLPRASSVSCASVPSQGGHGYSRAHSVVCSRDGDQHQSAVPGGKTGCDNERRTLVWLVRQTLYIGKENVGAEPRVF